MYREGEGVEQDDTQAVKWFQKAADNGYARAMYEIGSMYAEEKGFLRIMQRH